ncbi:MAG: hypothetical protein ACK4SZ_07605 [Allosphingosinicella sp.]|uniref:hypothetical protein n=1 Tax=Allosphingosinicella sp. TaxID=2823234 RepID=UPI0039570091
MSLTGNHICTSTPAPAMSFTPAGPIKPTGQNSGILEVRWAGEPVIGREQELSFKQQMRFDRKFVRGVYKCGFEVLTRYVGIEAANNPVFDHVRDFVRYNRGGLQALAIFRPRDDPREGAMYYYMEDGRPEESASSFSLFGIEFVCDFHRLQPYLRSLEAEFPAEYVDGTVRRLPYC